MSGILAFIFRLALSLRYKVTVKGLDQLAGKKGILVLPNHPAEVDPVLLSINLWKYIQPRPVVLEFFYKLPLINFIMRYLKAIPMPDMDYEAGPYKRRRVQKALDDCVTALQSGESILIYPAGRLTVSGEERLGAATGVAAILNQFPEVNVALVRIRGLYGSTFSKAVTGGITPDLPATVMAGVKVLFKNLIFFTPRRPVSIEIELNPPSLPKKETALKLNRYLESWYNYPNVEKPILVSRAFWKNDFPEIPPLPSADDLDFVVDPAIEKRVYTHLAKVSSMQAGELKRDMRLAEDLGLDSLCVAELLIWLDQEFEVTDLDPGELVSVGSILAAASAKLSPIKKPEAPISFDAWAKIPDDKSDPKLIENASLGQAFLRTADRMGSSYAVGDLRSGIKTWPELKRAVLILSQHFSKLEGEYVGVLLPASVSASITVMALILARKVPVLLNWTAGRRSLEHAVKTTNLKTVVTAEAFMDLVQSDLEFLESKLLFLEQIVSSLTLTKKLKGAYLAKKSAAVLEKHFGLDKVKREQNAVVLFTSGSESVPKGVPLTHKNIMSNVEGILEIFPLSKSDTLYGFLPPFHSFGLTVCTILPMTSGLRVAFHANPNESRRLAKGLKNWQITITAGTPTFLRSMLNAGESEMFSSLRFFVAGAERTPPDLIKRVEDLGFGTQLLEGYGITECSPVVSANRPGSTPRGVGEPLKGVEIKIVSPEDHTKTLKEGSGLILVSGPSIFPGYIGLDLDPFIKLDGKVWYNTGDIGNFEGGKLVITGRLKRFIKIGGEMISLGAIEEALSERWPSEEGIPQFAVVPIGTEGDQRPSIVLVSTANLSSNEVNEALNTAGFPHLVKISEVKKIDAMPILGSGKTDMQALKAMVAS